MVTTVLVQGDKSGKVTPVTITSSRLTYADNERKAHFDGAVQAKGADVTINANQMDVYLQRRGQTSATPALSATRPGGHILRTGRRADFSTGAAGTGKKTGFPSGRA